jgi:hypothetical protein
MWPPLAPGHCAALAIALLCWPKCRGRSTIPSSHGAAVVGGARQGRVWTLQVNVAWCVWDWSRSLDVLRGTSDEGRRLCWFSAFKAAGVGTGRCASLASMAPCHSTEVPAW